MAEAKLTSIAFASHPNRPEIIHCTDGEKFIDLLREMPLHEISYILLDLNMPRMGGMEVLEIMSKHPSWRFLPTIVFSSSAFEKDILTCYNLGASAYVVKPVEFDELDRRLTAINDFWAETNRLPQFAEQSEV